MSSSYVWPQAPYKGLSYYAEEDLPLFAGRDEAVRRCAHLLAVSNTRLMIVHGPTGCGKSSFLRAGLIPALEKRRGAFKFVRTAAGTDALFVRSTATPLKALAAELYKFIDRAEVETVGGSERVDLSAALLGAGDSAAFVSDAGQTPARLIESLKTIAAEWPTTLVLIVDQGEEVFTLNSDEEKIQREFFDFVFMFNNTDFDLKLIVALRSEFHGRFIDGIGHRMKDLARIEGFYLDTLDRSEMIEAIRRPTSREPIDPYGTPYDEYKFTFEAGVPEQITDSVLFSRNLRGGAMPIVQIICSNLYSAARPKTPGTAFEITKDHYKNLPDVALQCEDYLERALKAVGAKEAVADLRMDEEIDRWKGVLCGLSNEQIDGTVVTQLRGEDELRELAVHEGCRLPFEPTMKYLAASNVRVLRREEVINSLTNKPIIAYSLGHDAIGLVMGRWKTIQEERKRADEVRKARMTQILYAALSLMVVLFAIGVPVALGLWRDTALTDSDLRGLRSQVAFTSDPQRAVFMALHGLYERDYSGWLHVERWFPVNVLLAESSLQRAVQDSRVEQIRREDGSRFYYASFSQPQGEWIVTVRDVVPGASQWLIEAWDDKLSTMKKRREMGARPYVAMSGRNQIAVGSGRQIAMFTLPMLEPVARRMDGPSDVKSIAVDPDGRCVATGFENGELQLWEPQSAGGKAASSAWLSGDDLTAVAFSADGRVLAVGGQDHYIYIYSVGDGCSLKYRQGLVEHDDAVTALAFAVNEFGRRLLATAGQDGHMIVWREAEEPSESSGKSGKRNGQEGSSIGLKFRQRLRIVESNTINSLAFSSDGRLIASSNMDGEAQVRETEFGRTLVSLGGHTERVMSVGFHPDPNLPPKLLTAGWDGTTRLWDVSFDHSDAVIGLAFNADGSRLATGSWDGFAKLWSLDGGQKRKINEFRHRPEVKAVAISDDGRLIAAGGVPATVSIWNTADPGDVLFQLKRDGSDVPVSAVAFSHDVSRIAVGDWDGVVTIWDSEGHLKQTLQDETKRTQPEEMVERVIFEKSGNQLLVVHRGVIRFWKLQADHHQLSRVLDARGKIYSAAAKEDWSVLVAGGFDGTARLWKLAEGDQPVELPLHGGAIRGVAFNRDGSQLITGSADKTAKIWSVEQLLTYKTGDALRELRRFDDSSTVFAVGWTHDEKYAVAGGGDKMVHVYPLIADALLKMAKQRVKGFVPTRVDCDEVFRTQKCPKNPWE